MKSFSINILLPIIVAVFTIQYSSTFAAVLLPSEENAKPPPALSTSSPVTNHSPITSTSSPKDEVSTASTSASLEQSSSSQQEAELTSTSSPTEPPAVKPLSQPKGRNMIYRSPPKNVVLLAPIPAIPDYPEPILTYKPSDSLFYDYGADVLPTQYEPLLHPEPIDNLRSAHVVVYPSDNFDGDMAAAESNIVFRPLFTYKRQTAQRRRVYSKPPTSSSSSRNEQRGPQGYPYQYPSYGYPNYYPSYHGRQFDTVA